MSALPTSVRVGAHHSVVALEEGPHSVDAFHQFLDALPPAPDAALVLAVPADAAGMSAEALAEHTPLPIIEVTAPTPVQNNHVYLSPPGQSLRLYKDKLRPDGRQDGAKTATQKAGVPLVHLVRTAEQGASSQDGGDGGAALHLVVHSASAVYEAPDLPLVVVKGAEDGSQAREENGTEPLGTSRTERLERELRETRRELRDTVQKYEGVQRRLRRANEVLQEKNILLEERTGQVRSLSQAVALAEEKERERLSHVLHDDLQQILYAVRTKIDLAAEREALDERGAALLSRGLDLLDDGIETTRTLASDLNPPVENSLRDTLEWLIIQMQEAHGLSVEMRTTGRALTTEKSLRVLVVRLVRELLFNVVKHAGTQEAVLAVTKRGERVEVVVEDDGEGFDPDALGGREDGFGLTSVRRRIELAGGRFEIDTAPGEGTRVRLGVPLRLREE
jgi:signal transduction histidine kinase